MESGRNVLLVAAPQLGVNEMAVKVVENVATDGQAVQRGDVIIVLETSKATFALEAKKAGLFYSLVESGQEVLVSETVALIGADRGILEELRQQMAKEKISKQKELKAHRSMLATDGARRLAMELGIDLAQISAETGAAVIREADVRRTSQVEASRPRGTASCIRAKQEERAVVVYGAGAGAVTLYEAMSVGRDYEPVAFLDDDPAGPRELCGLPVLDGAQLSELRAVGIESVACEIAKGTVRVQIMRRCEGAGLKMINVIHPEAFVAPSVRIGVGNFIKARAVLETGTELGDCCIVDNGAVVAHDNLIGTGCHLGPGVSLGSGIEVGEFSIIGIGASVSTRVKIGRNVIVAVGSAVTTDVADNSVIEGVPGNCVGSRRD